MQYPVSISELDKGDIKILGNFYTTPTVTQMFELEMNLKKKKIIGNDGSFLGNDTSESTQKLNRGFDIFQKKNSLYVM